MQTTLNPPICTKIKNKSCCCISCTSDKIPKKTISIEELDCEVLADALAVWEGQIVDYRSLYHTYKGLEQQKDEASLKLYQMFTKNITMITNVIKQEHIMNKKDPTFQPYKQLIHDVLNNKVKLESKEDEDEYFTEELNYYVALNKFHTSLLKAWNNEKLLDDDRKFLSGHDNMKRWNYSLLDDSIPF